MIIQEAIDYFTSQQKAAEAMGLTHPIITYYKKKGGIPFDKQCLLEKYTKGKLKAKREDDPCNPFYKPRGNHHGKAA